VTLLRRRKFIRYGFGTGGASSFVPPEGSPPLATLAGEPARADVIVIVVGWFLSIVVDCGGLWASASRWLSQNSKTTSEKPPEKDTQLEYRKRDRSIGGRRHKIKQARLITTR
jgi:hypothetical protein